MAWDEIPVSQRWGELDTAILRLEASKPPSLVFALRPQQKRQSLSLVMFNHRGVVTEEGQCRWDPARAEGNNEWLPGILLIPPSPREAQKQPDTIFSSLFIAVRER